jgi:hypothetical protein
MKKYIPFTKEEVDQRLDYFRNMLISDAMRPNSDYVELRTKGLDVVVSKDLERLWYTIQESEDGLEIFYTITENRRLNEAGASVA